MQQAHHHDIALVRLRDPVADITPARLYRKADELGKIIVIVGGGDFGTGLTGPGKGNRRLRGATNKIDEVDGSLLLFRFDDPREGEATELEGISGWGTVAARRLSRSKALHILPV